MRSDLFKNTEVPDADGGVSLQNVRMLKVPVEAGNEVLARQGSMVAYQGQMDFDFEGSGGIGRFLKKALTGEGVPLMRVSGSGDLFLARDAREISLIHMEEGDSVSVNGDAVLAFSPGLEWDIRKVEGVSFVAGGLFNMVLSGTGWVALTVHGTPVVLQTDQPTFVDVQAAVAWSGGLTTSIHRTFKAKALIGRGSGEAAQMRFDGQGWVVVQASEGQTVPPHSHGNNGGGLGSLLNG